MSEIIAIELATPRTSAEDVELAIAIALVLVKAAVVEAARALEVTP